MFFVIMRKKTLEKIKQDRFQGGYDRGVKITTQNLDVEKAMFNKLFNENSSLREKLAKRYAAGGVEIKE